MLLQLYGLRILHINIDGKTFCATMMILTCVSLLPYISVHSESSKCNCDIVSVI